MSAEGEDWRAITEDLEARIKRLEEALQECEAYFEERADAEYFTDVAGPVGNREMTMLVMVQEALK